MDSKNCYKIIETGLIKPMFHALCSHKIQQPDLIALTGTFSEFTMANLILSLHLDEDWVYLNGYVKAGVCCMF